MELYDPLVSTDIALGDRRVPLESDLTTPLAYFLNDPRLDRLATTGLLTPDRLQSVRGLYMVQPYEPGKIPVLMVHGLWSSPMTWMEMFNDLRSVREIRDHYQFWFYLYPTGQPFWISAAQLRRGPGPRRGKCSTRHTASRRWTRWCWSATAWAGWCRSCRRSTAATTSGGSSATGRSPTSRRPPEERQQLAQTFFFQPNPSIRRVVTIGTPHHGSKFSNETTQWLADKLITLPERTLEGRDELFRDNPGLFRTASLCEVKTSIDSLAPDSPIFPVLQGRTRPPWVKYHNIVGVVPRRKGILGWIAHNGDGAVSYRSAHVEGVESELIVPADHMSVHRHPLSVLEVQKILLLHLDELRNYPNRPPPREHVAAAAAAGEWGPGDSDAHAQSQDENAVR